MAYDFKPIKPAGRRARGTGDGPDGAANPLVKVSSYTVSVPDQVYRELGSPARLNVEVDIKHQAFRLVEPTTDSGYVVRKQTMKSGIWYWNVFNLSSTPNAYRNLLGTLPAGWYKPIGGGVFEYDRPTKSRASL